MVAIVSLRGISRSYVRSAQRLEVLQYLDLEIAAGEFIAVLGPPASGKTTLLNLISGFDRPDAGAIFVAGARIDTLSPRDLTAWCTRHVGFVLQSGHLLPMLSAERNVEIPLLMTPLSRYELRRSARAALDLVGLIDRADRPAGELSGGQQQRVAIARALVAEPTILLCDEPTGDLDRATSAEILQLLQRLNEQSGTTLVMVTHDPCAARSASRILRINDGRLMPNAPAPRVAA